MKEKLMKIFRDLMKFGHIETDNGILIYEGDVLTEGTEVFIEDETGNIVPAPDGTYSEYVVKDGKIAPKDEPTEPTEPEGTVATEEVTQEAEPAEPAEPEVDNTDERISALEQAVAELKGIIAEMVAKKEEEEFSSLKPAEKEIKDIAAEGNKGAMKYFKA